MNNNILLGKFINTEEYPVNNFIWAANYWKLTWFEEKQDTPGLTKVIWKLYTCRDGDNAWGLAKSNAHGQCSIYINDALLYETLDKGWTWDPEQDTEVAQGSFYLSQGGFDPVKFTFSLSGRIYLQYETGSASIEVELSDYPPFSRCSLPDTIQVPQYLAPGHPLKMSWSIAKEGYQNPVAGYQITLKKDAEILDSATLESSEDCELSFENFRSLEDSRGDMLQIVFQTIGEIEGFSSEEGIITIGVNRLPNQPEVTFTPEKIPSDQEGVYPIATPGVDEDQQVVTIYWADGLEAKKEKLSDDKIFSEGIYYFWSYDGLEYSKEYTAIELKKNTPPKLFNGDIIDCSQLLHTTESIPEGTSYVTVPTFQKGLESEDFKSLELIYTLYVDGKEKIKIKSQEEVFAFSDVRLFLQDISLPCEYTIEVKYHDGIEYSNSLSFCFYLTAPKIEVYNNRQMVSMEDDYRFDTKLWVKMPYDEGYDEVLADGIKYSLSVDENKAYKFAIIVPTINDNNKANPQIYLRDSASDYLFSPEKWPSTEWQQITRLVLADLEGLDEWEVYGTSKSAYNLQIRNPILGQKDAEEYGLSVDWKPDIELCITENYSKLDFSLSDSTSDSTIVYKILSSDMFTIWQEEGMGYGNIDGKIRFSITNLYGTTISTEKNIKIVGEAKPKLNEITYMFSGYREWERLFPSMEIEFSASFIGYFDFESQLYWKEDKKDAVEILLGKFQHKISNENEAKLQDGMQFEFENTEIIYVPNVSNGVESAFLIWTDGKNKIETQVAVGAHNTPEVVINDIDFSDNTLRIDWSSSYSEGAAIKVAFQTEDSQNPPLEVEGKPSGSQEFENYSALDGKDYVYLTPSIVSTMTAYTTDHMHYCTLMIENSGAAIIVYNTSPTIAYRQNGLGINTNNPAEDSAVTINAYDTRNFICLRGLNHVSNINLTNGRIEGFIIDCGSWDDTSDGIIPTPGLPSGLATIAYSGDIADLQQNKNITIVLSGGSASAEEI